MLETLVETEKYVQLYIDGVINGSINCGKFERLAVQRHMNDLESGHERGLYFDADAAQDALTFFPILQHSIGKWGGQPFILEGWQKFIVWVLFGWKRMATEKRRFRIAYNEVARKNGKSTFAAGLELLALVADGERGAQVYTAATKMDQARIIHKEAERMVQKSEQLQKHLTLYQNKIVFAATESECVPLGADAKTMDGLNPHWTNIDEFHAHKSSAIWDVIISAVGAREQPMIFAITTAGFNVHGICHDQHDYAIKVLEGTLEDDTFFAFICTLDEGDDWKDENNWRKANPNLGITVSIEDMRSMRDKAINSPAELNNFLCKKLNIWTNQETKFFDMEKFKACNETYPVEALLGQRCWIGVDMSTKIDITSLTAIFELPDDKIFVLQKNYCPKETAIKRSQQDSVSYLKWAEQGHLTLTPGNVVDYNVIMQDILSLFKNYDVEALAYDKWNFEKMRQDLIKEGAPEEKLFEFGQSMAYMSDPTKELGKIVVSGKLVHNNNPMILWFAGNTAVAMDGNENIKPMKNKSSERIDGIVSIIEALAMKINTPETKESVYESRGALIL